MTVIEAARAEARKHWVDGHIGAVFPYRAVLWGTLKQVGKAIPQRLDSDLIGEFFLLRRVSDEPEAYAFSCGELRVVLDAVIRCPPPPELATP